MATFLEKIALNKYRLSSTKNQSVQAIIYAKEELLSDIEKDISLTQLEQATRLATVVSPVIGMPDLHQGFGLPIGGIMATQRLLSVGAVGMDINCGVRLLKSQLNYEPEKMGQQFFSGLISQIERLVPTGVGGQHRKNQLRLDLKKATTEGVNYLAKLGYATQEDIQSTEEYGCLAGARFEALTERAQKRGQNQLGTLGAGNHFIEILKVDHVFDEALAEAFGLFNNQLCVMIHCGSRALGHQTCLDYSEIFWKKRKKYQMAIPHKGLAALNTETPEAKNYFGAMTAAVNFAFCNRQMITHFVRQVFQKNFPQEKPLELVYDVAHNIAKWEEYDGEKLLIHRKGATRALPAGHRQNPEKYLSTGHPAIIPGSMATPSYVVVGTNKAKETFYSVNHGAGRLMSRTQAKKTIQLKEFNQKIGSIVHNHPFHLIADEAPQAYKDIDLVVDTLVEIGITKKVVKLLPLAVIQGH